MGGRKDLGWYQICLNEYAPIGKLALFPLMEMFESQLIEIANDFLAQKVFLRNWPMGGLRFEWSLVHKYIKVIRNEIMVDHGFPKPTSIKSTYSMKEWKKVEVVNDYNDQLFPILERQLMKKFFTDKLKLNLSKDPPPKSLMDILNRWKFIRNPKGVMADAFILENSYMCQEITNMSTLKEVFDFERYVYFLQ
jgi:hypothetical protein